jgi:hypothetical protein
MRGWRAGQAGASIAPAPITTAPKIKMTKRGMGLLFWDLAAQDI